MTYSPKIDPVDLLLVVPENEWEEERLADPTSDIYKILAEGTPQLLDLAAYGIEVAMRFRLKHTMLVTVAVRVPIGLAGTALITRTLLEALMPSIAAQVGFGGILSKDLKLGDVAVASHIDCYLTKDKARSLEVMEGHPRTDIAFAGEVFRPSHSLVHLAMHLKHTHPEIYNEFQADAEQSLRRFITRLKDPSPELRNHVRSLDVESNNAEVSLVHIVHFASAEVVSTTTGAVNWLHSRNRKLAVIDMESGGFMAAAWEYCHRHTRLMDTLVIRGGGGFGDNRHESIIKKTPQEIHRLAFQNACSFLCHLLSAHSEQISLANEPRLVHVGILIPLEEEFTYFMNFLQSPSIGVSIQVEYREGRYYYLFERGGTTCVATFVGDMGLVKMALCTEDLYRAFKPNLLVILGIAGGFSGPDGDIRICDVIVAKSIDMYFHKAYNRMPESGSKENDSTQPIAELRAEPPILTSQEFIAFVTESEHFAAARSEWSDACAQELAHELGTLNLSGTFNPEKFKIAIRPEVRGVRLASGEFVAGSTEFVNILVGRGCSAVDMEAGGAAIAYQRFLKDPSVRPSPKLLVLRGISDRGDEDKNILESSAKPNMFRKACVRNASRLLLLLLENEHFVSMTTQPDAQHPDSSADNK